MTFDTEEVALRTGTTADWAGSSAPVLALGELGADLTTGEVRVGDGTGLWATLRSVAPKRVEVVLVGGTKVTADTSIKATSVVVPVVKTLGTVTSAKAMLVTKVADTSFAITSSDATDTSTLDVLIYY